MKQVIIDFDKCDEHEKEYIKDCLNLVGCDHWRTEQDINADLLEACEYAVNYLPDGHRFAKEKLQQAINKAKGEIK